MLPIDLSPPLREALARLEPQIARLPNENLYVLDPLGNVVGHRVGGKRSVKPGKRLARWMREHPLGFVITHNHPRGTAHSSRDVLNLFRRYAAESRVVTPQGTVFRVQPLLRLKNGPKSLYACQAALDAAAHRLTQEQKLERLLILYAQGVPYVRLPPVLRYGREQLPGPRSNPAESCGRCGTDTIHEALSTSAR